MANRPGQLAGLAALGALGYMLSKDKKGEAPVESRTASPNMAPSAAPAMQSITAAEGAGEQFDASSAPKVARARTSAVPTRTVVPSSSAAGSPGQDAMMANYVPRDRYARSLDYPDESLRGRMATRAESAAPVRNPNISSEVERRTGVKLNSTAGAGRGGQGGPTAEELAAYAASRRSRPDLSTPEGRKRAEQAQALEGVYPEQAMIAPGIKSVAALAKGLANRAPRLAEMTQEALAAPVRRLPAPTYLLKKKGGTVKKMASGGSTSSASKRADGIAQRGKTRGKLY